MENRELKFRAWHKRENCFLDWLCIRQTAFNRSDKAGEYGLMYQVFTDHGNDFFVIEQFTTLKDKKQKDIYEADLLKDHTGRIWLISWDKYWGGYVLIAQDGVRKQFDGRIGPMQVAAQEYRTKEMELVGNIHENPELISSEATVK